jgi:hypothetical protein
MNKLALIAALGLPCAAMAHSDIRPRVEGAKIVVDAFDDGTSTTEPNVYAFGFDFGEDADDPFFVDDPGFNASSASGLTPGAALRLNLLSGLSFWDGGGGAVSFAPVATGESLRLNFGGNNVTASGASGFQNGFNIQTVDANGVVHRHLNSFLNGADGNTVPAGPGPWGAGDGVQAANGIYLLTMELALDPAGAIATSDPIFIVFNSGLTEVQHDLAIDWVDENLVPEPAAAALVLPVLGLLQRRRR